MRRARRARRPQLQWSSEAEMCAAFMDALRDAGWAVHPETLGYDLVAVSPSGRRFGVEAKLRDNIEVLAQATAYSRPYVHCRVALVPYGSRDFHHVARRLRVILVEFPSRPTSPFMGPERDLQRMAHSDFVWEREVEGELPPSEVAVAAGVPAPKRVTQWKLKAVRFCIQHAGQVVTSEHFKEAQLNMRLWREMGWLAPAGQVPGRHGRNLQAFSLTGVLTQPDRRYPEIAAVWLTKCGAEEQQTGTEG